MIRLKEQKMEKEEDQEDQGNEPDAEMDKG
jgi:hypothetical protein